MILDWKDIQDAADIEIYKEEGIEGKVDRVKVTLELTLVEPTDQELSDAFNRYREGLRFIRHVHWKTKNELEDGKADSQSGSTTLFLRKGGQEMVEPAPNGGAGEEA